MKHLMMGTLGLVVALATGCAADTESGESLDSDFGAAAPESELTASIDRSAAADMKLASLATETIKCRGKLTPDDYVVEEGRLAPSFFSLDMSNGELTFPGTDCSICFPEPGERKIHGHPEVAAMEVCPAAEDSEAALEALNHISNLLGVQKLESALAAAMVQKWEAKSDAESCPEWTLERVLSGDPEVEGNLQPGDVRTTSLYTCEGDGCALAAATCAAGYGNTFVLDAAGEEIVTDPAYWEDPRDWGYGKSPYYKAQPYGYKHNMAAYDDSYANIARVGEICIDPLVYGVLVPSNCSDDPANPWYCSSECK